MKTIFEMLGDALEQYLKYFSSFKIGKTGQKLPDRYNEEYSGLYGNYREIYSSFSEPFIDSLEEYLIERFYELPNCDNEEVGGGKIEDSDRYILYVVFNVKKTIGM